MARLRCHGAPVLDYVRRKPGKTAEEFDETTIRLMSDGSLMRQDHSAFLVTGPGFPDRLLKTRGGWKMAKLKPEIMANPDRLIEHGFVKQQPK